MTVEVEEVVYFPPCRFDAECDRGRARWGEGEPAIRTLRLVSGAGHDASTWRESRPPAMIFVPCKDGISHNEIEDAKPEHLAAGCNVLLHAMVARATAT